MTRDPGRIGEGRPCRSSEMGTAGTIERAVMAGLGPTVTSGHTVVPEFEAGRLVTLPLDRMPMTRSR